MNADGFGLSWYQKDIGKEPGLYKSIQPAWNDANLKHLANKLKSTCFLAHVRASTVGEVSFANCHPFVFGEYSFVHNGTIRSFEKYRRGWLAELDLDLFEAIRGQTDSELLFYLILQEMRQNPDLVGAVRQVFNKIKKAQEAAGEGAYSLLNIALTNGSFLIATRYATKDHTPLSLCYAVGSEICRGDRVLVEHPLEDQAEKKNLSDCDSAASHAVIVASEALTDYAAEWVTLGEGEILLVEQDFSKKIENL
jgi:predicted glutamine amidotransferase